MNKKNNKLGISLIALSIVILVLVLLSGIITYVVYDIIATAKNTAYAKDMETIKEAVIEYYAVNGSLPIKEDAEAITSEAYKNNIKDILGEEAEKKLDDELKKNSDEDSTFYEIDISKIGVDDLKYGIRENDNSNDIYVISINSNIIYYYIGYENTSGLYFSNSDIMEK